jgi:cobalt-zinc-cadmium efflux system protein
VVVEAVHRIQEPQPVRTGLFLAVASAGLLVNLTSLAVLHAHREGSLNVRGAYLHVLGDALGSVGAVAAAVIIALTGWTLADPIASILLSLLILLGATRLLRDSTDILLESVPRHVSMADVQRRMLGVPGVEAVHDLHVWTVTSGMVAMSGHAVVPDLDAHPGVLEEIRTEMSRLGIGHVTIQLEIEHGCEGCDDARESAVAPRWGTATPGHHHHPGHRH